MPRFDELVPGQPKTPPKPCATASRLILILSTLALLPACAPGNPPPVSGLLPGSQSPAAGHSDAGHEARHHVAAPQASVAPALVALSQPSGSPAAVESAAPHEHAGHDHAAMSSASASPTPRQERRSGGGGGGSSRPLPNPELNPDESPDTDPSVAPTAEPTAEPEAGWELWSDPATWGGDKPAAGEEVSIPAGKRVLLDENSPDLAGLTIEGELRFADAGPEAALELQADYIMLHGRLSAGSAAHPHQGRATITLNAPSSAQSIHGMGTRGILVMGGQLELYGSAPATPWTRLSEHAAAGGSLLSVQSAAGWQAGDQIILAPTDFYGISQTERLQVTGINDNSVSLAQGPATSRWGRLQYLSAGGMSLSPQPAFAPANPGTPSVLDERAAVGNLSRNIVIQGADDALWSGQGFGAQVMVMDADSVLRLDGVELRRMGQAGRLGRYPIHFHVLSYDTGGNEIPTPDASARVVRNSTVWNSSNRCITIHGSNDVTLDRNICYDIAGHAIFLEDAVERRNRIENNLVLRVRQPATPLLQSDLPNFQRGPSGFWLTNPDNTVTGNLAADTQGTGFWMAFPEAPLGLSRNVPIRPDRLPFGVFSQNTSHSNWGTGIQLDWVPFDAAGNTRPHSYRPSTDGGAAGPYDNWMRFGLSDITTFKNRDSGFWNRTGWPDFERWVSADNLGVFFAGAGADGNITRSLVVGESLNNATNWRDVNPGWGAPDRREPPVAFASYHSTFNLHHNTVVNFPYLGRASGAFRTTDYYITAVDRGLVRNPGNQLINSHPGHREPVHTDENWALAGALWDPHGYWGPAGNYWVYDNPFLSHGADCVPVAPAGENGLSCNAEYYGVGDFSIDGSNRYMPLMPIRATRYDNAGQPVGSWEVGDGDNAPQLPNMRHFAAMRNGRYLLEFPGEPIPQEHLLLVVSNAYRDNDSFVLGVPYSGSESPAVDVRSPYRRVDLQPAADLASVEAGPGNLYWQDTANHRIWVKIRTPGAYPPAPPGEENSDRQVYQGFELHIQS